MLKELCMSENDTGSEPHLQPRSSFDYIVVGDKVKWFCEDCRREIENAREETDV
jgi:hypothetical protein